MPVTGIGASPCIERHPLLPCVQTAVGGREFKVVEFKVFEFRFKERL